ncbi:MAG: tetratricopeptide repeat protein [Elusimicrobia bacterium]|nr:tetratricopeptide repeat protein [Elusimicrobiota bacterium]
MLAVRIFSHTPPGRRPWRQAAVLAGLLTVAAVCILSGAPFAAVPAVFILLAWPDLWPRHQPYVQFFYTLFVLQAAAALVWRAASPTPARTAVLAAAVGVSLLYRSPLLLLPPLLAGLEWAGRRERGRDWAVNALILLTVPYLPLLPWAAMNWIVHHQISFFERGESLPNIVSAAGGFVHYSEAFWRAQVRAEPGLQNQYLPRFLTWAFTEIARHPLRYAAGFAGRFAYAISLQPWLFAFGAAGAWACRRNPSARALALLCAYYVLIHSSIAVLPDYMVPLWPLLAALGAMLAVPFLPKAAEASGLAAGARAWLLLLLACACLAGAEADVRALRYAKLFQARPPESDQALAEALERAPRDGWLHYRRGWRRLKAGDRAGAVADLSLAAELRPDNPLWGLHRDWARLLAGDPEPLLAWNRPLSPLTAQTHKTDPDLMRAYVFGRDGRTREARERLLAAYAIIHAGRAPEESPHSLEILWDHARELFGHLPPKDWIAVWRELYLLFDDEPSRKVARRHDPMRDAVVSLQAAGAHREALALLRELLRVRPDSATLWTDKAVSEAAGGRWEASASDLRKALAADPAFLPASFSLGAVYIRMGRSEEALKVYDRALTLGSAASDPHWVLLRSTRDETTRLLRSGK